MKATTSASAGSTQKYVPVDPAQWYWPRELITPEMPATAPHGDAQSETVAIDIRIIAQPRDVDFGPEVIGRHVLHGLARKDAHAVELAAVQKHLREPQVIDGAGHRAAAAAVELVEFRAVAQRLRLAGQRIVGQRLRVTPEIFGRHDETRVDHAQRTEDPLLEKLAQRHAGDLFDDETQHVQTQAVFPRRARLIVQRQRGEPLDEFGARPLCRSPGGADGIDLVQRRVAAAVGQPEVWRIKSWIVISRASSTVAPGLPSHPGVPTRMRASVRQVLADRLVHHQPAFFVEHQCGDGDHGLGHRSDAEDRVLRHRRARGRIEVAERFVVRELALTCDREDRAGQRARRDLGVERSADALQAVARETEGVRLFESESGHGIRSVLGQGGFDRSLTKNAVQAEARRRPQPFTGGAMPAAINRQTWAMGLVSTGHAEVLLQDRYGGEAAPRAAREEQRLGLRRAPHRFAAELEGELDALLDAHRERLLRPLAGSGYGEHLDIGMREYATRASLS